MEVHGAWQFALAVCGSLASAGNVAQALPRAAQEGAQMLTMDSCRLLAYPRKWIQCKIGGPPVRLMLHEKGGVMQEFNCRAALPAVLALVLALALPSVVHAQTREFIGKIGVVTNEGMLVVENPEGDRVKFVRIDSTVVSGGAIGGTS